MSKGNRSSKVAMSSRKELLDGSYDSSHHHLALMEEDLVRAFSEAKSIDEKAKILKLTEFILHLKERQKKKLIETNLAEEEIRSKTLDRKQRAFAPFALVGIAGAVCLIPGALPAGLFLMILGFAGPMGYSLGDVALLTNVFKGPRKKLVGSDVDKKS